MKGILKPTAGQRLVKAMATLVLLLAGMNAWATGSGPTLTRTGHREGIDRTLGSDRLCSGSATNQDKLESTPKWHSVVMLPKTNTPPIHWYNKINPVWWLGNIEDPIPPAWYEPTNSLRKVKWYFRNPFSNFSFYVIGVADKETVRSGRYPTQPGNPNGGWNFAVTRRRIVFLPFMDYKNRRMEFYFGWRERGNFGIKLNFHRQPEKGKDQTACSISTEAPPPNDLRENSEPVISTNHPPAGALATFPGET